MDFPPEQLREDGSVLSKRHFQEFQRDPCYLCLVITLTVSIKETQSECNFHHQGKGLDDRHVQYFCWFWAQNRLTSVLVLKLWEPNIWRLQRLPSWTSQMGHSLLLNINVCSKYLGQLGRTVRDASGSFFCPVGKHIELKWLEEKGNERKRQSKSGLDGKSSDCLCLANNLPHSLLCSGCGGLVGFVWHNSSKKRCVWSWIQCDTREAGN